MNLTNLLLITFLIVVIIFNFWNAWNLKKLNKRTFLRDEQLNDSKYWEIKFQIQFIIAVFSALVAIAAFLGYNTVDNIRDKITIEINDKLEITKDSIENLDNKQKEVDERVAKVYKQISKGQDSILALSNAQSLVNESIKLSSKDLKKLRDNINAINSKNIIQQNIYIIENLQFKINNLNLENGIIFKFSDLITINGDKIPILIKPPFILPVSNDDSEFKISEVTNASFKLKLMVYSNDNPKVNLFITSHP